MTFLGLLGSVILTATVSNMKMKTVDSLAQSNFYTAESAMDEYKVGIEETAQACMKEAYTYMLQRYSATPDTERTTLLKRRFVNQLYKELTGLPLVNSGIDEESALVDPELLKTRYLISDTGKQATTVSGSSIKVVKNLNDYTVTLQGVTLRYTDARAYESTITTDIIVKATYPSLPFRDKEGVYYTDFGLIADGLIQATDSTRVNGNIYGGLGIHATVNSTELSLNSNKVISREGLIASNGAKIEIAGQMTEGAVTNGVWVKNVATEGTTAGGNTVLDITANCYVQDDLTLGEHRGNVKLVGNYYGYQMDNVTSDLPNGTADGSSSIVINAKNAVLDMRGLKNLWISGKSYLNIPSLYGSESGAGENKVLTGESLSFKGSQVAYLVPGKYINGIGHNPMTPEEYKNLKDSIPGYEVITNDSTLGIDMSQYVKNFDKPYTAYHVNFLIGDDKTQMVYLYWNFLSADHANRYFNEYQSINVEKLENLAASLQLGEVYLPEGYQSIINTGNILSYTPDHLSFYRSGMLHSGGETTEISSIQTEISNKKLEFERQYKGLLNYLKEDRLSDALTSSLVENLIYFKEDSTKNIKGIEKDSEQKFAERNTRDVYSKVDGGISDSYILVTTNEVLLDTHVSGRKGLILTNKDVTITNCEFTGMIITTGNITLSNATINADPGYVKAILDSTPEVSKYFKDFLTKDVNTDAEVNTVQISYENWYKE